MATRPDKLVADWIKNNTAESDTYFGGFPSPAPDEAVACIARGGPSAVRTFDASTDNIYPKRVQSLVRGSRQSPEGVGDRATTIHNQIDQASPPPSMVILTQGSWETFADDGDGRPLATLNVIVKFDE